MAPRLCVQAGYYSFLSGASSKFGNDTANGDFAAVQRALTWLKSDPQEPFAIFLPGIGAHPPYGAPVDW